jgi:hypothetical protein
MDEIFRGGVAGSGFVSGYRSWESRHSNIRRSVENSRGNKRVAWAAECRFGLQDLQHSNAFAFACWRLPVRGGRFELAARLN